MEHLSNDQLIEYQFQLGSDEQAQVAAGHLESCGDCRERLEQLKKKFSALDLLREDVHADEQLISRTLVEAKRKPVTRQFHIWRLGWAGAAAAVIIVAGGILLSPLWNKRTAIKDEQFARAPAAIKKMELEYTGVEQDTEMLAVEEKKGSDWMPERPPFAPASNIELVTLPRREDVQITIYNSADLTLVREKRNLTMKRGWNWLQFMWANTLIDPTSLSLEPLEHKDKIDVEQLVFPPRLKELGRWLIKSQVSGQVPFEITYLTSGISWRAFYMGTMAEDEKSMTMQGYVRVTNKSGEEYENAQTRLIVGKIHILDTIAELAQREQPYERPGVRKGLMLSWLGRDKNTYDYSGPMGGYGVGIRYKPKEIKKEGLSEYFLYTIEGRETIADGWGKRLPSFKVGEVPVVNLYKYEEERYGRNVVRFLSFKNDKKHKLGETPIPGGMLKVYRTLDSNNHLSYEGQSSFKYIPVDEDIELNMGAAENVVVEPKLMDYHSKNYKFDNKGNIIGWNEIRKYKITVKNTRSIPVRVEIKRNFRTSNWELLKSGDFSKFEKVDKDTVKFTLEPIGRSIQEFEYTLTTYHGENNMPANYQSKAEVMSMLVNTCIDFDYSNITLKKVIDDMCSRTGLNIVAQWNDLKIAGIGPEDLVNIHLIQGSAGEALYLILSFISREKLGMAGYAVDDKGIITIMLAGEKMKRDNKSLQKQRYSYVLDRMENIWIDCNYDNIALKKVIDDIRLQTGQNIVALRNDLECAGITPEDLINIQLEQVNARKVLDLVLSYVSGGKLGMAGYELSGDVIEIKLVGEKRKLEYTNTANPIFAEVMNRLENIRIDFESDEITFKKAIDGLRLQTGQNIVVQWNELDVVGITPQEVVAIQPRKMSARKALDLVLDHVSRGKIGTAGYVVDDAGIIIIKLVEKK